MARVTRTLVNDGPTGKVRRDEVDVVTLALQQGRLEDVISGRVLMEYRASQGRPSGRPPRAKKAARTAAGGRRARA
ncbi:hypothetical protein [Longimicrobium terrae]|uniref:Uncharacterized protein n=1 Tax=Longimicrobium terrae TaxID=1639882 RepID=A0A841H4B1_9BACT|nr:hypothetical protein [Longimicrobium terrae]MBB4638421.1 hypothetical protein [Longimicrobium terrae]MBB6072736.1 hypothetical protein [Longimicrobium terrae]NNC32390.1 hypothetical protein [Longimicrobium terrae]